MEEKTGYLSEGSEKTMGIDGSHTPTRPRPQLPSFSPRVCEESQDKEDLKQFAIDVNALKKIDFVKTYTRSRALTPSTIRDLSVLSLSPVRSSAKQNKPSTHMSEKKLKRSLSLKLLTYKLIGSKGSSMSLQHIPQSSLQPPPSRRLVSSKSEDHSPKVSQSIVDDSQQTKFLAEEIMCKSYPEGVKRGEAAYSLSETSSNLGSLSDDTDTQTVIPENDIDVNYDDDDSVIQDNNSDTNIKENIDRTNDNVEDISDENITENIDNTSDISEKVSDANISANIDNTTKILEEISHTNITENVDNTNDILERDLDTNTTNDQILENNNNNISEDTSDAINNIIENIENECNNNNSRGDEVLDTDIQEIEESMEIENDENNDNVEEISGTNNQENIENNSARHTEMESDYKNGDITECDSKCDRYISSLVVTGLCIPKIQSPDEEDHHEEMPEKTTDHDSEDEGLCEDLGDSPQRTSNEIPQRRTGTMSVITSGNSKRILATGQNEQKKETEPTEEVMTRRQPRFVTHPPHRKTAIVEVGSMDSNGLGTLKTAGESGTDKHNTDDTTDKVEVVPTEFTDSATSLTDSHPSYGDSDIDEEGTASELADIETPIHYERNKSDSFDFGSRIDEMDESSTKTSRETTPLMIREEDLTEVIPPTSPYKRSSSTEILSKQSSTSSSNEELKATKLSASPGLEEKLKSKQSLFKKKSTEFGRRASPRLERNRYPGGRFSTTVPPLMTKSMTGERSMSSSERLCRPYALMLSVPPPKKPVFRSMSSASNLQKDRRVKSTSGVSSKNDEPSDDSTDPDRKLGSSVPNFLSPYTDTKLSLASSMPDVTWEQDSKEGTLESPDTELPPTEIKDKRYMIVEELYHNEQEYVDALQTLKDKYMRPLKVHDVLDENVVDDIFYMIPEILTHHLIYHSFLDRVWKNWDSKLSTVGDIIIGIFSKQTVLNSYLSFVENYKSSGKVIEHALQTKSSVMKFVNKCQQESGTKLSLKDIIIRPIQRIPRYELLIQRLSQYTPKDHPDAPLLDQAQKVMHELAIKIDTANAGEPTHDSQETLKKLEIILMTELAVPERLYLKHEIVEILNKKDSCCVWLFSDVLICSSVKRKTGTVTRKSSVILQYSNTLDCVVGVLSDLNDYSVFCGKSPSGQDFVDNLKHKVWLQVGLDDVEVLKGSMMTRRETFDKEQLEDDLAVMSSIDEMAQKLSCKHQYLTDVIKEVCSNLQKQLTNPPYSSFAVDSCKLELLVTTQEGVLNLLITFPSAEKRVLWEILFTEAKQKLSQLCDKRAPEFLQPLQITKTRAGMQFSCAASIDGLSRKGFRDVWVCNSDGYVGHVCLLSLQPEPIVTLNTPVPGCHARILCIGAVPCYSGPFKRKGSNKTRCKDTPMEEEESEANMTVDEEGYQSDSEDTSDDEPLAFRTPQIFLRDAEDRSGSLSSPASPPQSISEPSHITTSGVWMQDPLKSTMWLGTEDGCIHVFQCTDNMKTTKNKLKIMHGATVLCIVYLDNKVFVSLGNGDLAVYKRDQEGLWNCEEPIIKTLGNTLSPISKMIAVAGRLWCGVQGSISVINTNTLHVEKSFVVMPEANRTVQCLVNSGHAVWIACHQSSRIYLYHATTFELLLSVNVAQTVSQKLQSTDDIIRQHKTACLRITALLICKDLLWVGTSAGVILTVPMLKVTSTTKRGTLTAPTVTGLVYGHTGHVRFLTSVELPSSSSASKLDTYDEHGNKTPTPELQRRMSMAVSATLMANRMLVISGGDGYEDFRANSNNETAGRDDSTNHLLLWQV